MDLSILGATGRIGRLLVNRALADPEIRLVGCYVSDHSAHLGLRVPGAEMNYEPSEASLKRRSEVIIDFSTPSATMKILENLPARTGALIIGTTGFTDEEGARVRVAARQTPILASVNFAESFGLFVKLCKSLQSVFPEATPELEETYHQNKSAKPSGTSRYLAQELDSVRSPAAALGTNLIPIRVNRRGATVGEHVFRIALEGEEYAFTFSVLDKEAYAKGAMQAARWILGRPNGLYAAADMTKQ